MSAPANDNSLLADAWLNWDQLDWTDIWNAFPDTLRAGAIHGVRWMRADDGDDDERFTDLADVFVHMLRVGFRSDDDLRDALRVLAMHPDAAWARPLRDAIDAQYAAEANDRGEIVGGAQ